MANRFRKLAQADLDLGSIWDFIAADDVRAAERQLDRFEQIFQMLAANPLAGRERPELRTNLRSFPAGSYIIFYLPLSDGVEVIRVMHGRQDIDADEMV